MHDAVACGIEKLSSIKLFTEYNRYLVVSRVSP